MRVYRRAELSDALVRDWAALEARSVQGNAFLSPHFVLPALRHLTPGEEPLFVTVSLGGHLAGMGVFVHRRRHRHFPMPHLEAYASIHSYQTGLLVDREHADLVLHAFFAYFRGPDARSHAVMFDCLPAEGPLAALLGLAAEEQGATWHASSDFLRAVLLPAQTSDTFYATALRRSGGRKIKREIRRLEEHGPLGWRMVRGADVSERTIERFVELEHRGWKGEQGTSLRARPGHEEFFREMCRGFLGEGRIFFTELSVGDEVIASTCNFLSGNEGFAFKVGWDRAYARSGPGTMNELFFIREVRNLLGGLDLIDSGAPEGSFIERLWPMRRKMVSGFWVTSRAGRLAALAVAALRRVKATVERRGP